MTTDRTGQADGAGRAVPSATGAATAGPRALGAHRLVEDVSLTARPGEVIGLVGPNGSGKSSLLRAVYRVLCPTTGQVGVDGTDAWSLPVRQLARTVAAAVQESGADSDLTVREVVAMARARRGHHHAVVSARCVRADSAGPAGSW